MSEIYFYKESGKWIAFSLTKSEGIKWVVYCKNKALSNHTPPNRADYHNFLKSIR